MGRVFMASIGKTSGLATPSSSPTTIVMEATAQVDLQPPE
jgi:hypothetical protein